MSGSRRAHWQRVYDEKEPTEVSWYQSVPAISLQLIRATAIDYDDAILDAGGGASTLVDHLQYDGYTDISVLDIAGNALEHSRDRLGAASRNVYWIESDVLAFDPGRRYALWHDRAVFHFLTDLSDREKYLDVVRASLRPGGHFVVATFGPQGPVQCSGLDIQRHSIEQLKELLGANFALRGHEFEEHETPMGSSQQFLYSWWHKQ